MEVQVFIPCFIEQFYPQTARNTIRVLEKAGMRIVQRRAPACCGQPFFNAGVPHASLVHAKTFLNSYRSDIPVVIPSASCAAFIRNEYQKLSTDKTFLSDCAALAAQTFELSDFLVNRLGITRLGASFFHTVTVHDSCAAVHAYGLTDEPRQLLAEIEGLQLIEMEGAGDCCGFGGTFSVTHRNISEALVNQKAEFVLATGAEYVVSTEASCLMNIGGYLKRQQLKPQAIHLADVLAAS